MGIVAHADCVAAHFFQLDKPACPHLIGHSGAETACVVMQADAF